MSFRREPFAEDVTNRVRQDYAADDIAAVVTLLDTVTGIGDSDRVPWIQLACLRLAGGRKELIGQWIELGNRDWRDLQLAVERHYGAGWEREYILYDRRT
jgi:hypothetical protein